MKKAIALQMMMLAVTAISYPAFAKDGASCTDKSCTDKACNDKAENCNLIKKSELKRDLTKVTLVDALDVQYFDRSHVKGSINVPVSTDADTVAKLLPDKNAKVVVYCMNTKCHAADAVAKALVGYGYKNVSIYRQGLQDLIASGFDLEGTNPKDPIPQKTASN
jgi:rhodanese-related sulfurtransferase